MRRARRRALQFNAIMHNAIPDIARRPPPPPARRFLPPAAAARPKMHSRAGWLFARDALFAAGKIAPAPNCKVGLRGGLMERRSAARLLVLKFCTEARALRASSVELRGCGVRVMVECGLSWWDGLTFLKYRIRGLVLWRKDGRGGSVEIG